MGLREFFKRLMKGGKDKKLKSEQVGSGELRHIPCNEEQPKGADVIDDAKEACHEAEEVFYEEEQRSFESLSDDSWVYEEEKPSLDDSAYNRRQFFPLLSGISDSSAETAVGTSLSSSAAEALSHSADRQRPILKLRSEESTPRGSRLIKRKFFISNKDIETGECFPPRTSHVFQDLANDEVASSQVEVEVEGVSSESKYSDDSFLAKSIFTTAKNKSNRMVFIDKESQKEKCQGVVDETIAKVNVGGQKTAELSIADVDNVQQLDAAESQMLHAVQSEGLAESFGEINGPSSSKLYVDKVQRKLPSSFFNSQPLDILEDHHKEEVPYGDTEEEYSWGAIDNFDNDLGDGIPVHEIIEGQELEGISLEEFEDLSSGEDSLSGFFEDDIIDDFFLEDDIISEEVLESELVDTSEMHDATERISLYLKAYQKASEFIARNHWDDGYLPVLSEVLNTRGYGTILSHLQRYVDNGMVPEEFLLAIQLKHYWSQSSMFWINFHRNGDSDSTYRVLSWAQCLRIIRVFGGSMNEIPQIEEVESFIDQLYELWYEDDGLRRYFKAFSKYLYYEISQADTSIPVRMQLDWRLRNIEAEDSLGWEPYDPMHSHLREQLAQYGVSFRLDYPEETKTCFDLRYRNPLFNPEMKKVRPTAKGKGKKDYDKRIGGDKDKVETHCPGSQSGKINSAVSPAITGSAEELMSSLQGLLLRGHSKEEAARMLGLSQAEIKNHMQKRKK